MTFDLTGLSPAAAAPTPTIAHRYGFARRPVADPAEAIALGPGEHLRDGGNLLPVIRAVAGIAARLADLAGVTAVAWHPARTAMAPPAFVTAIDNWLHGGAFPALGLTALYLGADGAIRSEGLAFFTGQELLIEPDPGRTTALDAKIAARLINQLVGIDTIQRRFDFIGPNGEYLSVEPSDHDRLLRVWQKY